MRTALAFAALLACLSAHAMEDGSPSGDPYGILLKPIPEKLVVLTFDDACRSHATFVGPLLKRQGFGATFYICEFGKSFADKTMYMTWEQIKALDDMGFEIGNHTVGLAVVKRSGYEKTASPLSIAMDGVPVFTLEASRITETWGRFTSPVFAVTAGSHTLAFILGEGGMVLIDNVVLHDCK